MVEALLWLALLSPLQLVVLGHSANQVVGNLSLLGLMILRTWRGVGAGCGNPPLQAVGKTDTIPTHLKQDKEG